MSYSSQTLVNICGGPYVPPGSSIPPDVLTVQKANPLYVNETGDTLKGDLDMGNHRLKNLAYPKHINDAISLNYLSHTLMREETKKIKANRLPDKFPEINMDGNKIINVGKPTNPKDVCNKEYVDYIDNRVKIINDLLSSNSLTQDLAKQELNMNSKIAELRQYILDKPKTFGYILNIGPNNGYYKTNVFNIKFDSPFDYMDYSKTPEVPYPLENYNFQITPLLGSTEYHDEIFISIRKCILNDNVIKLDILTVRSTKELWGLDLKAYLLITQFKTKHKEILPLKNGQP
jgi:hypothetical protein